MKTLADAQLEREKIKAAKATRAFEEALAATISKAEAETVLNHMRRLIADELPSLARQMTDAVGEETDETRIHYLMSDVAIDWLRDLASKAQRLAASDGQAELVAAFVKAIKPKPLLTVSQWAEKYRMIATGTNLPGFWRNENAPHLTEIMDSLSEHSPIKQVTFKKSSGVGGTELMWNWIGYLIHHVQNKDFMLVVPTLQLRDREFNPRFKKMVSETPVLSNLISFKSRDTTTNQEFVEFGQHARFIKTGANSPDSLRATHLPYVMCDEVSAFPWDAGGEGDPITLIENRQKTFTRFKRLYVSTPTNSHECRITTEFEKSDQRHRYVPCPHCGERFVLQWEHCRFEYDPASLEGGRKLVQKAWMQCPKCDGKIEEHQKNDMLDAGVWIPHQPHVKDHRGYHINAFYIKYGLGKSWVDIAQEWVDAQADDSKLKTVVNTYFGEVWEEASDGVDPMGLLSRLESFDLVWQDDAPEMVRVAGVDIQKNRFEITVVDFEKSEEAWVQEHIIVEAETAIEAEWEKLAEALDEAEVMVAAIDSGHNTDQAYEFCQQNRWCVPIKGVTGMNRPLIEDKTRRNQRLRRRRKKGIAPEPLGVDQGKGLVMARLKLPNGVKYEVDKSTGEITKVEHTPTPGFIHFNNHPSLDDEYFKQLTAERLVTKKRAGRDILTWVKVYNRNEALDCMVYALSAFRLSEEIPSLKRTPRQFKPHKRVQSSANPSKTSKPIKPKMGKLFTRRER